jgi:purine nucleosidase
MKNKSIKKLQKPVFFDCNGTVDDYIALMSILTLDKYTLTGIALTPGCCDAELSVQIILKILDLFCAHQIEVVQSDIAAVNEYPASYTQSYSELLRAKELLDLKADMSKVRSIDAADFTAEKILENEEKTVVISTGSAANLAATIERYPEVSEKIEKILWVAGAFLTDGNVVAPDHDGSAEWNFFWHPQAADKLLNFNIPMVLFPLDSVTQYPVDNYLMYHLEINKEKRLSEFAHLILKPCYEQKKECYLGALMPSVYLGMPGLFQFESKAIKVELRGTSMGNIYRASLGSRVKQASCIDEELFYDCILAQFDLF